MSKSQVFYFGCDLNELFVIKHFHSHFINHLSDREILVFLVFFNFCAFYYQNDFKNSCFIIVQIYFSKPRHKHYFSSYGRQEQLSMCGLDGSLYANFEKVSSLHEFDWFLGPFKIFVFGKKKKKKVHT